jgi:hypothetical protein
MMIKNNQNIDFIINTYGTHLVKYFTRLKNIGINEKKSIMK